MRGGGMPGSIDKNKPTNPWASLKRILPWITPYWSTLLFGFACMFLNTFLTQQSPRIIQHTIDEVLKQKRFEEMNLMILLFVGANVGTLLTGFLRTYWLHVAGQRMLHDLRARLYGHFQRLSLTYYDNRQTGDLMSRMTSDVEQIEQIMVHGLDVLIMGVFGMILTFYYMFGYEPRLALLVLIPVPVIAVGIYLFSGRVRAIYRKIRDAVGSMNARLQDNISGIRVIKAFTREEVELAQVTDTSRTVLDMNIRGIRMWSSWGPFMQLLSFAGTLIVFAVGGWQVAHGQLGVGRTGGLPHVCRQLLRAHRQPVPVLRLDPALAGRGRPHPGGAGHRAGRRRPRRAAAAARGARPGGVPRRDLPLRHR